MRILISGASGLIGKRLTPALVAAGHEVWGLSRQARAPGGGVARWFAWDSQQGRPPAAALEGVGAVVHLAGEPVIEERWTAERKRVLLESRRAGTRHLVEGLAALPEGQRPAALLSASAVGYYGDRGDAPLAEDAPPGRTFLAGICVAWEEEAQNAAALGVRVVRHRIGVVLDPEGGALHKMLPPFRMGLGGRLGHGTQYLPWIHRDDVVAALQFTLARDDLRGPVNLVAPAPVTNRLFSETLGHVLHRPAVAAVPKLALKLALGEAAGALLESQRVLPARLEALGFRFRFPALEPALRDLLAAPT